MYYTIMYNIFLMQLYWLFEIELLKKYILYYYCNVHDTWYSITQTGTQICIPINYWSSCLGI